MALKLYLAGPDVFLPNAREIGRLKKDICAEFGFEGLFPLDTDEKISVSSRKIFTANCGLMRKADIGIFNCSPFRGPGADAGTAFEIGYLFHAGKTLWGYTNSPETYRARVSAVQRTRIKKDRVVDTLGLSVEDFGLADNLMLIEAIRVSRGRTIAVAEPQGTQHDPLAAMAAFKKCLEGIKKGMSRRGVS